MHGLTFKLGTEVHKPPWALVLAYEHEIRKAAIEKVAYEKLHLAAALQAIYKDMEHRQQHFLTPTMGSLMMRAAEGQQKAPPPQHSNFARPDNKRQKTQFEKRSDNKGKGSGKGFKSGKGFNKGKGISMNTKTPDNKDICFRWNRGHQCDGKCGRSHCCQICFGQHPQCRHEEPQ